MHFDWWTLALQLVNFAVLVWLLNRFLYKPVLRMIDARKAEIQRQYDAVKAEADKVAGRFASLDSERVALSAEREATLKAAAASAEEIAATRRMEAEHEAEALLAEARKRLANERDEAFAEARRMAIDLGSAVARRLLSDLPIALRAEAWLERIERYLQTLPTSERASLLRQLADGTELKVVTATALPNDTIEIWRNRLRQCLSGTATINFEVDGDLIAGAELHFPGAVLHFSWRNALASMRKEIEADANAH